MNFFTDGMNGKRYANARPEIHPAAIEKFREFAKLDKPFDRALDVGCGTGHSTVALTPVAKRVIGIDPSVDMLAHAAQHPNVEYMESKAESTPFGDGEFDLITVAQAFHWLDHDRFLGEAFRLLRAPGWLVIYTSWFTGEMKDEPTFSDWFNGDYLSRYPTPPRDRSPMTKELAERHRLSFLGEEEFFNEVVMTLERFTDFMLSTTNVIGAVRDGECTFDDAGDWIRGSLGHLYASHSERPFLFKGRIWYVEKRTE